MSAPSVLQAHVRPRNPSGGQHGPRAQGAMPLHPPLQRSNPPTNHLPARHPPSHAPDAHAAEETTSPQTTPRPIHRSSHNHMQAQRGGGAAGFPLPTSATPPPLIRPVECTGAPPFPRRAPFVPDVIPARPPVRYVIPSCSVSNLGLFVESVGCGPGKPAIPSTE